MFKVYVTVFLALFLSSTAMAEVVQLAPNKDNTLFEDDAGSLSNGAGLFLFIGLTGDDNGIPILARRAVISFNLAGIPPESIINSVELTMSIDRVPPGATSGDTTLHRLTSNWGEGTSDAPGAEGRGTAAATGDATWLHTFFDTQTWNTPGGDFVNTPSATVPFSTAPETLTFNTPAVIADVQSWVNDPASNNGWILLGDEVREMNARRLLSRESTGQGSPQLVIDFTRPPREVPSLSTWGSLLLMGLFLGLVYRRLNRSRAS